MLLAPLICKGNQNKCFMFGIFIDIYPTIKKKGFADKS